MKTLLNFKKVLISIVFLMIVLLNNMAQWTNNNYKNTPVCTNTISTGTSVSISDEKGGAFIAWQENFGAYVQHIDSSGVSTWAANGLAVSSYNSFHLSLATDGNDGVFVSWEDDRNGTTDVLGQHVTNLDVFCQHIDKDGNLLWVTDGLLMAGGTNQQTNPKIISDFNKGFVLVWEYYINEIFGTRNIQIQRFNSSGTSAWASFVKITDTIKYVESVSVTADSLGGAFISWTDNRNGSKIYAQHVNSLGEKIWGEGIIVTSSPGAVLQATTSSCTADGNGGMFVAWSDRRNSATSDFDIYAQHILSTGKIAYEAEGKLVCNAKNNQYNPNIVTDGKGGAIIAWSDTRNYESVYIQRIGKDSSLIFENNGIRFRYKCTNFSILPDYDGGAFLTAVDGDNYLIFARHLLNDGNFEWNIDFGGTMICGNMTAKSKLNLCSDNRKGIIVVWDDNRNGPAKSNVFAQRVLYNGDLAITQEVIANLSISSNTLTIAAPANSTKTFDITSNTSWTIAKNQDWLSLSNTSGSNNATITLTAGANTTKAIRIATVTVSGAGVEDKIITITQDRGTTEISNKGVSNINIYPNPANNLLFIDGLTGVSKINIYDINGKLLLNKQVIDGSIDISNLNVGLYFIIIEYGNTKYTMKFEKNNN